MTYCINPHCPKPVDAVNANKLICLNCRSEILLQGRYRVLKQLGQGGFGNTFEVDECGKTKVLKVLTENNPKAIELFQQEAKVLSQLNSAGIPKVEPDGYFTVLPKNSSVPYYTKFYPLQGLSWIYGTENQGMSLFISKANEILEKYSCNLKEDEPKNIHEAYQHFAQQANNKYSDTKNLATELSKWIHDCNRELGLVPKTGDLKLALTEIESLKNRLSDFKNLRQTRIFS